MAILYLHAVDTLKMEATALLGVNDRALPIHHIQCAHGHGAGPLIMHVLLHMARGSPKLRGWTPFSRDWIGELEVSHSKH